SCCCVKPSNPPAKTSHLPPSSSCLPSAACHRPSDPITASPSPVLMLCSISPSSPSGGSGSASRSSASNPASRSKMAATSVCTSPSRPKQHARPVASTAAGPLRCFPPGVQYRKTARGSCHEVPGRNLLNLEQAL